MKTETQHPLRNIFIGLAIVGTILSLVAVSLERSTFFVAYLPAYFFWLGITVGSLCITMIYHLTGGRWATVIRRYLEAGMLNIPLMLLLFLPIFFGLHHIYSWSHAEIVSEDKVLQAKSTYLNIPFFVIRSISYFLIWEILIFILTRRAATKKQLRNFSAGGLVATGFLSLFVFTDWLMSLEPHWYSTMFPVLLLVSQGLIAAAFCVLVLLIARLNSESLEKTVRIDLGNILLTFVLLWSYLSFMQYLIVWSGNLPEEVVWYKPRIAGIWGIISILFIVLQFFLPFVCLLFRDFKRRTWTLVTATILILVMQFIYLCWLVFPAFPKLSPHLLWIEPSIFMGVGGWWIFFFLRSVERLPEYSLITHPAEVNS